LKLGVLLVQEHRCAAVEQDYQAMLLHMLKNVFAFKQATMSAATLVVHATTHQHYALEVVQKLHVSAGMDVHQKLYTKADTIQVTATALRATIHGVGAAKAAIQ
jgi:hypothetical protein